MFKLLFLILVIFVCIWGYQNFDTIKSTTINSIQNEKTIKQFNVEKNQNSKDIEEALKY